MILQAVGLDQASCDTMTLEKTIIIAFDGLDINLIKKFNCENLLSMKEFGSVDNTTGMKSRYTSELFASFITGGTHQKHGVTKLNSWTNPKIEQLEKFISKFPKTEKFKGLRYAIYESINSLDAKKRKYRKEDLEVETIFDKLDDSRAMNIPSYNPSIFWMIKGGLSPLELKYSLEEAAEHWETREYRHRKKLLFSEIENEIFEPRSLLMAHFHKPDIFQHLWGDKDVGVYKEDNLKPMYKDIDELAGEIKEKALDKGYDRVIFMSDHGLPGTDLGHNENAFYSCNKELFEGEEPKITDFYDKLLSLCTK